MVREVALDFNISARLKILTKFYYFVLLQIFITVNDRTLQTNFFPCLKFYEASALSMFTLRFRIATLLSLSS